MGKTAKPRTRDPFHDHGIVSALILLYQFQRFEHCVQCLKPVSLPTSLNRDSAAELTDLIAHPPLQSDADIVRAAAAAIALHNVDVEIWDADQAKRRPYSLSLRDYRITLNESPLAFLVALTDVLQCWDRPKRRYVDDPADLAIPSRDVRIRVDGDLIVWTVVPDRHTGKRLIDTAGQVRTLSQYLACEEKGDLGQLLRSDA